MNWKFLFLDFKGRISRWYWWIGTVLIIAADYAISISSLWLLGGDPNYYWNDALPTKEVALADSLAFLATLHFSLALDIKRIHDRGKSAYLLVPLYLFSLAIILSQSLGWDQAVIWMVTNELNGSLPFEAYVIGAFYCCHARLFPLDAHRARIFARQRWHQQIRPRSASASRGTGMNWKFLLFSFKGRITRRDWWIGYGLLFAIGLVYLFLEWGKYADVKNADDPLARTATLHFLLLHILLLIPTLALYIKRFHDLGRSGWWALPFMASPFLYAFADLSGLINPYAHNFTRLYALLFVLMFALPAFSGALAWRHAGSKRRKCLRPQPSAHPPAKSLATRLALHPVWPERTLVAPTILARSWCNSGGFHRPLLFLYRHIYAGCVFFRSVFNGPQYE